MATFPALMPARREWAFPDYPTLRYSTQAWGEIVFQYGDQPTETPLELVYTLLDEQEMQLLRDHFIIQRQTMPFPLPSIIWAGYQLPVAQTIFPITSQWLYASELEEEPVAAGLYDVTVSLITAL